MRIVFDLDGTLADCTHRLHCIQKEPKDWETFFSLVLLDRPIQHTIRTLQYLLKNHCAVEIWTARSEETEDGKPFGVEFDTFRWLRLNVDIGRKTWTVPRRMATGAYFPDSYNTIPVRMRERNDHREDHELKREWLRNARLNGFEPDLVFEDRQRIVDMWRSEGIPCFQVAEGRF